jgi:hypothetical protein
MERRQLSTGTSNASKQLTVLQAKDKQAQDERAHQIKEIECTPRSIEQLKEMIMKKSGSYCLRFNRPLSTTGTPSHVHFDRVWESGHPAFDVDLHTGVTAEGCDLCRRAPDLVHDEHTGKIVVMRIKEHGAAEAVGLKRGDSVVRCYPGTDARVQAAARKLTAANCTTISGNGLVEIASSLEPLVNGPSVGVELPRFSSPGGVAVDAVHQLVYIADTCNHCIRMMILDKSHSLYGHVLTIAGSTEGVNGHRDGYGAGPGVYIVCVHSVCTSCALCVCIACATFTPQDYMCRCHTARLLPLIRATSVTTSNTRHLCVFFVNLLCP